MNKGRVKEIIKNHDMWLRSYHENGARAELIRANLSGANLPNGKKYKKITKKKAFDLHLKLWNYLKSHKSFNKTIWPEWDKYYDIWPDLRGNSCFLCIYFVNCQKCAFTWIKRYKHKKNYCWGMGSWTRANAELCLLATKGRPKRISAGVHSIIDSHREAHSKKPDIVREKIIQLCGDLPRIKLFARQRVTGWDCWGNELPA